MAESEFLDVQYSERITSAGILSLAVTVFSTEMRKLSGFSLLTGVTKSKKNAIQKYLTIPKYFLVQK